MLLRMYLRYCEKRGYKTEIVDYQEGEEAGLDAVSFTVEGDTRTDICEARWASIGSFA